MKNILLITSLYPCDDVKILNNTAVCHYFAKEWVKGGYNVKVIFNYHIYPRIYYPFLRLFRKQLANIKGISIQDLYLNKRHSYTMDGVEIDRIPIYKGKPGGGFTQGTIDSQVELIKNILKEKDFTPDIILGHFTHPSLELVTALQDSYHAKTAVSIHGPETMYSPMDAELFNKLDFVGFRSYPTKWSFEKLYGEKSFFMCPSGVPENYITKPRQFNSPIKDFIYVGTLMKRKYPSALVPAIANNYSDRHFTITYVGDGADKKAILESAKEYNCVNNIVFTGRIDREKVTVELDKAQVFIMISKIETFGLVYLEAMARGLIVVASKKEGMDGIIEDGVNGFLCEAGNAEELSSVVKRIKSLNPVDLNQISQKAIETAKAYTDSKVAKQYIQTFE